MERKLSFISQKGRQNIETSTYGAEFYAGRVGIEHCQETRHVLRSLGAEVNLPTKYHGDNKSLHESCANENTECKSRHSSISYQKMRQSVAAGMSAPCHVYSEENIADVLTKPIGIEMHNSMMN